MTNDELRQRIKDMREALATKEKEETEAINKEREGYRQEVYRLYEELKKDAFSTITGYSTKQLEMAWERAYESIGYEAIVDAFQDLIDFIEQFTKAADNG